MLSGLNTSLRQYQDLPILAILRSSLLPPTCQVPTLFWKARSETRAIPQVPEIINKRAEGGTVT